MGVITDEYGDPLPGASVVEKNTTNGTTTDFDGNFSIDVTEGAVLVISYLGYLTQEITIGDQSSISVQLVADTTQLEDVVVVGYGVQTQI